MRKLFWAAALGGGIYWASKQQGGIQGVWDKFSDKLHKVQDSPDPLGAMKSEFLAESQTIEPATNYTPLPDTSPSAEKHHNSPQPMAG